MIKKNKIYVTQCKSYFFKKFIFVVFFFFCFVFTTIAQTTKTSHRIIEDRIMMQFYFLKKLMQTHLIILLF